MVLNCPFLAHPNTQWCRTQPHSRIVMRRSANCNATFRVRAMTSSHPRSLFAANRLFRRLLLFGALSLGFRAERFLDGQRVQRMLVLVMFDRHLAVEPGPVHGIGVGIEDHAVEVPRSEEHTSE